jgi:hypothetical protein
MVIAPAITPRLNKSHLNFRFLCSSITQMFLCNFAHVNNLMVDFIP